MKQKIVAAFLGFAVVFVGTAALSCNCLFAETHMNGSASQVQMKNCHHDDNAAKQDSECSKCTIQKALNNFQSFEAVNSNSNFQIQYLANTHAGYFSAASIKGRKSSIYLDTSPPQMGTTGPLYILHEALLI